MIISAVILRFWCLIIFLPFFCSFTVSQPKPKKKTYSERIEKLNIKMMNRNTTKCRHTVDCSEILHQHGKYLMIYRVLWPSQVIVWDFWTVNTKRIAAMVWRRPSLVKPLRQDRCQWIFLLLEKSKKNISEFVFYSIIYWRHVFFWNYFRSVLNIHYVRFDLSNVLFLVLWLAWWFVMVDIMVFFYVLIWIHIWHWIFL